MALGPDGLYVAGKGKIAVYKCAPKGGHVNLTPHSLKFSEFSGICFDANGHIIACDWKNSVYFFKPSGKCVGHVGSDVIQSPTLAAYNFCIIIMIIISKSLHLSL